jgi:hypothetical protein
VKTVAAAVTHTSARRSGQPASLARGNIARDRRHHDEERGYGSEGYRIGGTNAVEQAPKEVSQKKTSGHATTNACHRQQQPLPQDNSQHVAPHGPSAMRMPVPPVGCATENELGIGSGAFKVLAMDRAMSIPFKVSTTIGNSMIGVTVAASAGIYLRRGYVEPGLAMPPVLGVLAGSLAGARILVTAETIRLRRIFGLVIVALALEMIYGALTGTM